MFTLVITSHLFYSENNMPLKKRFMCSYENVMYSVLFKKNSDIMVINSLLIKMITVKRYEPVLLGETVR